MMNQNLIPFLVKDVEPGSDSSGIDLLGSVNGNLIFSTFNPPVNGLNTKLWKTDGSDAGTVIIKDFGSSSFPPTSVINVDDTLYFITSTSFANISLFRSDGTESGTFSLVSLDPRSPANIGGLTGVDDTVFYTGFNSSDSFQSKLFRIDNDTNNPVQVQQNVTAGGANPSNLTGVNSTLFFSANANSIQEGTVDTELWKSDGTDAGTVLVKDINPTDSSNPSNLTDIGSILFFTADDGTNGSELWKSDGSEAGTTLIKDINPGSGGSNPSKLTDVNGTVYFIADNGNNGSELWKSDGTEAGTVLVKEIIRGSSGSNIDNLTNVNGTLFFTVNDGSNGTELWKSNGTTGGTAIVADINPGANSSNPGDLTNVDGILYFTADDGSNGIELWKSDGTAQGTSIVGDINPGSASSNPGDLTNLDGQLYFSADDGVNGRELWGLTEDRGSNDDIFGVKDSDPSEFDNIPTKPNQVTIVPTETGDIELPRRFNTNRFNGVVAIDGANGTGGTSEGGADFAVGSAVLRDGGDGSENRWNFSGIELRNIAYINGRDGNDRITGSAGADNILGGGGNDDLRGGKGEDTIEGGAGDDLIRGRNGNDLLLGGSLINNTSDDDILEGGGKDDILDGQKGNDTLSGGAGKDKFVLSEDFGKDIITDFKLNRDEIINATEFTVLGVTLEDYAFKVSFNNTDDILQVNINGNKQARLESYLLNLGSDRAKPY